MKAINKIKKFTKSHWIKELKVSILMIKTLKILKLFRTNY